MHYALIKCSKSQRTLLARKKTASAALSMQDQNGKRQLYWKAWFEVFALRSTKEICDISLGTSDLFSLI